MQKKDFPEIEYPKDEKELIIRQWDRVFRIGSSSQNPMQILNATDLLEVALSDKIDDPNDGTWKKKLEDIKKGIEIELKKLASRKNIPIDELTLEERYPIVLKYYKKMLRIFWILTTMKGTFGEKSIKGLLDENVVEALWESTNQ